MGPEVPLVAGLADDLMAAGIATFGPSAKAAQLEGSKSFMKVCESSENTASGSSSRCLQIILLFGGQLLAKGSSVRFTFDAKTVLFWHTVDIFEGLCHAILCARHSESLYMCQGFTVPVPDHDCV